MCKKSDYFACSLSCIPRENINDNKFDCPLLLDENTEEETKKIESCTYDTYSTGFPKINIFNVKGGCHREKCPDHFYSCWDSQYCISVKLICDGIQHCLLGDDEYDCGIFNLFVLLLTQFFMSLSLFQTTLVYLDILNANTKINIYRSNLFVMEKLIVKVEVMKYIVLIKNS